LVSGFIPDQNSEINCFQSEANIEMKHSKLIASDFVGIHEDSEEIFGKMILNSGSY